MRLKFGLVVFALFLIFVSIIGVVSAGTCVDNDTIMKLYNSTNSHGALWDYSIPGGDVPLYRCYNSALVDHMDTKSSNCEGASGYVNEGVTGYLYSTQKPGTIPFYRCYNSTLTDHMFTNSSNCEGASGYVNEFIFGYGYSSLQPNTYQFNRCYNSGNADHLTPFYPYDSCPEGYNFESRNWFIFKDMADDYNYDICCSDVFGVGNPACNPAVPHPATCTNPVLWLYQNNNSNAAINNLTGYNIPVCYGDLTCRAVADPTNCAADENVTVRLMYNNNSHISDAYDINYLIKICCKAGAVTPVSEAYWANMMDIPINTADLNDDVKLIVKNTSFSGREVNFTIYEPGGIIRKILSFITFGFISADPESGEINGFGEAKWVAEPGDRYYFIATLAEDSSVSIDSRLAGGDYGYLNVSDVEINQPITVDIIYPSINLPIGQRRFKVNKEIPFELNINSPDDDVQISWDFGDGNITEKTNCLSTNKENCKITNHSYNHWGTKTVYLTAEEMRRGQQANNYTIVFIYNESINVFALITEPKPDWVFGAGARLILFNVSLSWVANCTTGACSPPIDETCYNVDDLKCYDLNKTGTRGIGTSAGQYNLWFDWTFSEGDGRLGNWTNNKQEVVEFERLFYAPTKHWANLRVGYEAY